MDPLSIRPYEGTATHRPCDDSALPNFLPTLFLRRRSLLSFLTSSLLTALQNRDQQTILIILHQDTHTYVVKPLLLLQRIVYTYRDERFSSPSHIPQPPKLNKENRSINNTETHVAVIDLSAGRLVVVAVVVVAATAAKLPPRSKERSNRPCSSRVRYPTKTARRTRTRAWE